MPDDLTAELARAQQIADGLQFACRDPRKTPDFSSCGGPAAEQYWEYFTPARISAFLAALGGLLKAHATITIYKGADWCGCERPSEDAEAFADWVDDHPHGTGPGDTDALQICHRSPLHDACPACSELVYGHRGDEDCWVHPSECVAMPLITRALTGEEAGRG